MRIRVLIIIALTIIGLFLLLRNDDKTMTASSETPIKTTFEKTKWSEKEGKDYPYREQMLNDVVYNDPILEQR